MSARTCTAEADGKKCERKYLKNGYCSMHWYRVMRTGEPGPIEAVREVSREVTSYGTANSRVTRLRGRADEHECVRCHGPAQKWAYRHQEVGKYLWSADPSEYDPWCIPCHPFGNKKS